MGEGNGSYVTWRELNLLREGIDKGFEELGADISEIKWSMNLVLENRKQRFRAWGPPLLAAIVAASVSLSVALLIH